MPPIEAAMTFNVAVAVVGAVLMGYAMKLCLMPARKQLA